MIRNLIRNTSLRDFLLPVGGAMVTIGLGYLADRETDARARLAALQAEIGRAKLELGQLPDHVEPIEQPIDGPDDPDSVLDAFAPFAMAGGRRRRPVEDDDESVPWWKLAGFALGAAAVIAAVKAGPALLARLTTVDQGAAVDVDQPEPYPAAADVDPLGRSNQGDPAANTLENCGWPSCDFAVALHRDDVDGSPVGEQSVAMATKLVTHRNNCAYRPAGMGVPGA